MFEIILYQSIVNFFAKNIIFIACIDTEEHSLDILNKDKLINGLKNPINQLHHYPRPQNFLNTFFRKADCIVVPFPVNMANRNLCKKNF